MAGKKLWELTMGELNYELEMAGIVGVDSESLAVIKLTMHLVRKNQNPSTFQFQTSKESGTVDVPTEGKENVLIDDFEEMSIPGLLSATYDFPSEAEEDQQVQSDASEDSVDVNTPELVNKPKEVIRLNTIISNAVKAANSIPEFIDDESVKENEGFEYPSDTAKFADVGHGFTDLVVLVKCLEERLFRMVMFVVFLIGFLLSFIETKEEEALDSRTYKDVKSDFHSQYIWPPDFPLLLFLRLLLLLLCFGAKMSLLPSHEHVVS